MKKKNANINKENKQSTIYDVACLAGVSAATVSHVLNKTAPVSDSTRKLVMKAVRELGYSRNENARALRTSDSKIIGIVGDISSEYYVQCIASLMKEAQKAGYAVVLTDSRLSSDLLYSGVCALINRRVNGLVFLGGNEDEDCYEMASLSGIPVVFADRYVEDYPCVEFNNRKTMISLVKALYRDGYRRFYYYGQDINTQQNLEERFGGFLDAVNGLNIPKEDIICDFKNGGDIGNMKKTFDYFRRINLTGSFDKKSVILTTNDMIAHSVVLAMLNSGLRVPEDGAVIGFDNVGASFYSRPQITTIDQSPDVLAASVFQLLLKILQKTEEKPENIILEQRLLLRDSVYLDAAAAKEEGINVIFDVE